MTATNQERFLLDEAEQAQRRLTEELIAAAREVVAEWRTLYDQRGPTVNRIRRMRQAIYRLEALVGRPG